MATTRLLTLIALLQAWQQAWGLSAASSLPICLYKTNVSAVSTNVFSVMVDTAISANAKFRVTYPGEFTAVNLGVEECLGYLVFPTTRTQVPCEVVEKQVTWTLTITVPGEYMLSVESVRNPSVPGGTGNFKVELLEDAYVWEVNYALGTVGITPAAPLMVSTVVSPPSILKGLTTVSPVINAVQTYTVKMVLPVTLPAGSWLRVQFPKTFNLGGPLTCTTSAGVSGACYLQDPSSNIVVIPGITGEVAASTVLTASMSGVQNPPIAGFSGFFSVECLGSNTYTQLVISTIIDGPKIENGPILNFIAASSGLKQTQGAWYTLQFNTTNPVPSGGYLQIIFPPEFGGLLACISDPSLVGLSGPVNCNVVKDFNSAFIGNFVGFTAKSLLFRIKATNPKQVSCSIFTLQSLLPNGNAIDAGSFASALAFAPVTETYIRADVSATSPPTPLYLGQTGPLELFLDCKSFYLPKTPLYPPTQTTVGAVILTLPSGTVASSAASILDNVIADDAKLSCLFGSERKRAMMCTWDDTLKQITIQTPRDFDAMDSCPVEIAITVIGTPSSTEFGFSFPASETGQQLLRVQTFVDSAMTVLKEEAYLYFTTAPRPTLRATLLPIHVTKSLSNHYQLQITPFSTLPVGYTIELEFLASSIAQSAFPENLGYSEATAGTAVLTPCLHDSALGSFLKCEVVGGSPTQSAFYRFIGCNTALTAGTLGNFWILEFKNGESTTYQGQVTIRTRLDPTTSVIFEQQTFTLPMLQSDSKTAFDTLTLDYNPTNYVTVGVSMKFTLAATSALNVFAGDFVVFKFPTTLPWTATNTSPPSLPNPDRSGCAIDDKPGMDADFVRLTTENYSLIVYKNATPITTNSVSFCFTLPNFNYRNSGKMLVFTTSNARLTYYDNTSLDVEALPNALTLSPTVTEVLMDSAVAPAGQRALYEFTATTSTAIPVGGSISILFPDDKFSEVDSTCFQVSIAGSQVRCISESGYSYSSNTYFRYLVTGWTADVASGLVITFKVFATPSMKATTTNILGFSSRDTTSDQLMDVSSGGGQITTTGETVLISASVNPFVSPRLTLRETQIGPLSFLLAPSTLVPASTSSTVYGHVEITIPAFSSASLLNPDFKGSTFSLPAGNDFFMECSFKTFAAPSVTYPASRCEVSGSIVKAYTPANLSLTSPNTYLLTVSPVDDSTDPDGFLAGTAGYLQFTVKTFANNVELQRAEPWVYIPPLSSFQDANVVSYSLHAGQLTALHFSLKLTTDVDGSAAGVLLIEFPYAGTGSGWADDLGTGKITGAELDCNIDSGNTGVFYTAKCYLLQGAFDYTRVKIANFGLAAANDVLTFTLTGIKNPVNVPNTSQYDLKLNVMSATWTEDASANFYTVLDWSTLDYIDTIITLLTPGSHSSTADPVLTGATYGALSASVALTITPVVDPSGGDMVLVMLQSDYLPTSGQTLVCTYGGATARACLYFAASHYLLVTLDTSPSAGEQVLDISPLTMPSYSSSMTITTYLFISRQIDAITTHIVNPAMAVITLAAELDLALLGKMPGSVDNYCFKLQPAMPVQITQSVKITFPIAYTTISEDTCVVSPASNMANSVLNIACQVSGNVLKLFSFPTEITDFVVCVNAENPNSTNTQLYPFIYHIYTDSIMTTEVEMLQDDTGVTLGSPAQPELSVSVGFQYKAAREVEIDSSVITPLVLTLKLPNSLTRAVGELIVTIKGPDSDLEPSLPTNGVERCVWSTGGNDYISEICSYDAGVFTLKAPATYDILNGVTYTLTLTTLGGVEEGLEWTEAGLYYVDVSFSAADGSALANAGRGISFFRVGPVSIPNLSVSADHTTAGYFSRYIISFTGQAVFASVAGGRIAIEFPGSMFDEYLGNSAVQHAPISCEATGLTPPADSLLCYLHKGNTDLGFNPTVIVTNFNTVGVGDNPTITLHGIKNPDIGGDDKIVWVRVSILDVSSDWPGEVLAQRKLENLFSVQTVDSVVEYETAQVSMSVTAMGDITSIYTFKIPAPTGFTTEAEDLVYLTLSDKMTLYTTNPDTLTCSDCSSSLGIAYFPSVRTAIFSVGLGGSDITVEIGNFKNPNYKPLPEEFIYKGVYIRTGVVIGVYTSLELEMDDDESFTIKTGSSIIVTRSDRLTAFYKRDKLDWRFAFTPTVDIPDKGGIMITLTGSTFNEDRCYNDMSSGSSLTGAYTCTRKTGSSNKVLILTVQASQAADLPIIVLAHVSNGIGTFDMIVVETLSKGADVTTVIERFDAFKVTFNAATAILNHNVPLQVKSHNYVRAGTVGSFSFTVKLPADLTAETGIAVVDLGGTFTVAPNGTLQCLWTTATTQKLAKSCSLTGKVVTIKTPSNQELASGTIYTVVLTSTGATPNELQGLLYPIAGNYDVIVTLCSAAPCDSTNLIITGTERLTVLPNKLFQRFSVLYGNNNTGLQNFIQFKFIPNLAISAIDGFFEIHFPTKDSFGHTLFDTNLGISLPSGSDIGCQIATGGTASTASCIMTYGDVSLDRPVIVRVKSTVDVAVDDIVTISFERIQNPSDAGTTDNCHISLTLISYKGAVPQEAQTYFNVFTVNAAPSAAVGSITDAPVLKAGAAPNKPATITITLPEVVPTTEDTAIYLLSIPFTLIGAEFPAGFLFPNTNTLVYISTDPANTRVDLKYTTAIPYLPIDAVIKIAYMLNGETVSTTEMDPIPDGGTLTAVNAVVGRFDYFVDAIYGEYGFLKLSFKPVAFIPQGGCMQYLVTEVDDIDIDQIPIVDTTVCTVSYNNLDVLPSSAYQCVVTPGNSITRSAIVSITGLAAPTLSSNPVNVIIRVAIENRLRLDAFVYYTYTSATECMYTLEKAIPAVLTIDNVEPPTSLSFEPLQVVPMVSLEYGRGDFVFNFKLTEALSLSTSAASLVFTPDINLGSLATGAKLVCDLTSSTARIATLCSIDTSVTPNPIKVYPQAALTADLLYTIKLTTSGANFGTNGLILPEAGRRSMQLTTYNNGTLKEMGVLYYSLPIGWFNVLKITPAHVSAGLYNIFKIDYNSPVDADGNVLVVEFPVLDPDSSTSTLFEEDLGTDLSTGQSLPCSGPSYLTCTLRKGNRAAFVPAQVRIIGNFNSGTNKVYIGGVKNPICTGTSRMSGLNIVMRVFIEDPWTGAVLADRSVDHVFWVDCTILTPPETITADWTTIPAADSDPQTFDIETSLTETIVSWIVINEHYSDGPFRISNADSREAGFANEYDSTTDFDIVWMIESDNLLRLNNIIPPDYLAEGSETSLTVYIIGKVTGNSYNVVIDYATVSPTEDMTVGAALTASIEPQYDGADQVMLNEFHIYTIKYAPPKDLFWAYVFIEVDDGINGTFGDVDETFLQVNSVGTDWTEFFYDSGFVVNTVDLRSAGGSVNILAKATSGNPKVQITVYLDWPKAMLYGSVTATIVTPITAATALSGAAITITPTPKLNVDFTKLEFAFTPPNDVGVLNGGIQTGGLAVDFKDLREAFVCPTSTTGVCAINGVTCASKAFDTAITLQQNDKLLASTSYTATISNILAGCKYTRTGYSYALMTLTDNATVKSQALIKIYVGGGTFSSFKMETLSLSCDRYTTVKITFKNRGVLPQGTMLEFSFPQTTGASFPSLLGLETSDGVSVTSGDSVPYYSSANSYGCFISPGGFSAELGENSPTLISCMIDQINAGTVNSFFFPKIKNPSDEFTATFAIKAYTSSRELLEESSCVNHGAFVAAGDCTPFVAPFPEIFPTSQIFGNYATYPFSIDISDNGTPRNANNGDYFTIILGSAFEFTGTTLPSASNGAGVLMIIHSPYPCPCVIAPFVSAGREPNPNFSIQNLINPMDSNVNEIVVYPGILGDNRLCYEPNTFHVQLASGALTSLEISKQDASATSVFYLNEEAFFTVTIVVRSAIPLGGSIEIDFPSTYFDELNALAAISDFLPGATYDDTIAGKFIISGLEYLIYAGETVVIQGLYAHIKASGTASITATTLNRGKILDTLSAPLEISSLGKYMSSSSFYSDSPTVMFQPTSDADDQSYVKIVMNFNIPTDLVAGTGKVTLTTSGSAFATPTSAWVAYFTTSAGVSYKAKSASVTGAIITVIAPEWEDFPSTDDDCTLTLSASNNDEDGLRFTSANSLSGVSVVITGADGDYTTVSTYMQGASSFATLNVEPFTTTTPTPLPFKISFKPSVDIAYVPGSIASELVVQFPHQDSFGDPVFTSSVFDSTVTGWPQIGCRLYENALLVTVTDVTCRFYAGSTDDNTNPSSVVVSRRAIFDNAKLYTLILPPVTLPAAGTTVDIPVFTRCVK